MSARRKVLWAAYEGGEDVRLYGNRRAPVPMDYLSLYVWRLSGGPTIRADGGRVGVVMSVKLARGR